MTPLEKKLTRLIKHIDHVRENTRNLGFKLIELGEVDFGIKLIAEGEHHDYSKFKGMEWDGLDQKDDGELLKISVKQHNRSNMHHPEYWMGIKNMPDLFIAEMVCDWKARSSEIGTDFKLWVNEEALKRFDYSNTDEVYKKIQRYTNLLLEQPLEQIK